MSGINVLITAGIYAIFLFLLANSVKKKDDNGVILHNKVYGPKLRFIAYSFALAVYCTSWTFFGAVGSAVAEGWTYLPVYLGPIVFFLFGSNFFERLVEAVKFEGSTSISNFIGSRFSNSRIIAALVTILSLLGIVPYLALQLRSVGTTYVRLTGGGDISIAMGLTAVILALFAMLFGTRSYETASRNDGILFAISVESILKLLAFAAVGIFATFAFFNAPPEARVYGLQKMAQNFNPKNINIDFFVFGFLASVAIVCLPRQFYVGVIQADQPSDIINARSGFIFYLLLTLLIALPIAMASFAILPPNHKVDLAVIDMPLMKGFKLLALFVFLGGFSAATGMVTVETIALSTMVSNDLIVPLLLRDAKWSQHHNFGKIMLAIRRSIIIILMAVAFLYAKLIPDNALLATTGLVAFAAVAQFFPALVLAVFKSKRDAAAAQAGITIGLILWFYTLLLPNIIPADWLAFLEKTPFNPHALLGIGDLNPITHGTLWSLGLNVSVHTLVAARKLHFPRIQIDFNNDVDVGKVTTKKDLIDLVGRFVGQEQAYENLGIPIGANNNIDGQTARKAERMIANVIGAPTARAIISSALLGSKLTLTDVTQMLDHSGQSLQFSKDILAATLEHIDPGVSVIDRDLNLVAWNSRYLDLFNYPPGMVRVGAPVANLIRYNAMQGECGPGEVEDHVERRLNNLRRRKRHAFERTREDGRVFKTVGGPMPDGGYVMCFTDITAEARARQALEKARTELEVRVSKRTSELSAANRALAKATADKTRFLAAASHDLLQPLHAARLFTSALERQLIDENKRNLLLRIEQSIDAGEKLLRRLLDISKLDAGGVVPIPRMTSLKSKMTEIAENFRPVANEKNLRLLSHFQDIYVNTDPTLFRSVVQNFLSNAVKYTKKGGVFVCARKKNGKAVIEVYDTGPGISKANQEAIFREFERLNNSDELGMGLGLSIVERTARLIGGKVEVKSVEGKGSRFSLILDMVKSPIVEELDENEISLKTIAKPSEGKEGDALKFLVVDDEKTVREGMEALIRSMGNIPIICSTYEEALAVKEVPNFILLDYELGSDKNGLMLAKELSAKYKNAGVALITARHLEVAQVQADSPQIRIFRKPLDFRHLETWINEALKK